MGILDWGKGVVKDVFGENTLAQIPVVNSLTGSQSDSEKELLKKQKQLAEEAKRRAQRNEQMRIRALAQAAGAFAPQNRVMAEMFGPDAAFSGQEMANLTANPMPSQLAPPSQNAARIAQQIPGLGGMTNQQVYDLAQRSGGQLPKESLFEAWNYAKQKKAEDDQEAQRRSKVEAAFATPQGPAPINPIQAAPARRY
jgi:hypothetical protein